MDVVRGIMLSIPNDRNIGASFRVRYAESEAPIVSWYAIERRCIWRNSRARTSSVIRFPTLLLYQTFTRFSSQVRTAVPRSMLIASHIAKLLETCDPRRIVRYPGND